MEATDPSSARRAIRCRWWLAVQRLAGEPDWMQAAHLVHALQGTFDLFRKHQETLATQKSNPPTLKNRNTFWNKSRDSKSPKQKRRASRLGAISSNYMGYVTKWITQKAAFSVGKQVFLEKGLFCLRFPYSKATHWPGSRKEDYIKRPKHC